MRVGRLAKNLEPEGEGGGEVERRQEASRKRDASIRSLSMFTAHATIYNYILIYIGGETERERERFSFVWNLLHLTL